MNKKKFRAGLVWAMVLVPPEYAWIIPLAVPFLIGLFAGVIVKRALKLILVIIALIIILVVVGYTQFPSTETLIKDALNYLPIIQEKASPLVNILPYTSASFLIGLALGLWKG